MTTNGGRGAAQALALGVPLALLAAVYIAQYGFNLPPCEMCWWQRYGQFAALGFAALALALRRSAPLLVLAALGLLSSGLIGGFHAGVEYHWWEGLTRCSTSTLEGNDPLAAIMASPLIRCDTAPWTLFGISLAGYNFLVSTSAALAILALLRTSGKAAR